MGELVSVVVPVYNMGSSIDRCIDSLLEQSYKQLDIILVDDGSKDDSYAHCLKYTELDSRIRAFHTENQGSGPARNYGISQAVGRYICFPDADDKYEADAIENMVEGMRDGVDFVIGGYKSLDESGTTILRRVYCHECFEADEVRMNYHQFLGEKAAYGINGAPWNKLYDMDIIRGNSITFPPLRRHQDSGFISRYLTYCKKIRYIGSIVYIHFLNDLSKEWYKYPENYIESVIGLKKVQDETVLVWNPHNNATLEIINQGYASNTIKAMELSFSPRLSLNSDQKVERIKNILEKSQLLEYDHLRVGCYQKLILSLLRKKHYSLALLIIKAKVFAEKEGIIRKLRG